MIAKIVLKHLGDQDWSAAAYNEFDSLRYSTARRGKMRALRAIAAGAGVSLLRFKRRRGSNTWEREG